MAHLNTVVTLSALVRQNFLTSGATLKLTFSVSLKSVFDVHTLETSCKLVDLLGTRYCRKGLNAVI
ncbi:hypothetical protein BGAL_0302g00170 [Botrytis galanthina]|uniref:Uncharacterized protein n=1 Tax=Botrytis galanthina TaxID=278940 RepID=A0A4S8R379_9HELO|nr:hypothetical protein BGAL_0302g00170 [Botrytis galanthina]